MRNPTAVIPWNESEGENLPITLLPTPVPCAAYVETIAESGQLASYSFLLKHSAVSPIGTDLFGYVLAKFP